MKPDWKDAPDWANHLAMDKTGSWMWYEEEPVANYVGGYYQPRDRETQWEYVEHDDWEDTLEDRP